MTKSSKNPMLDLFRIELDTHCSTLNKDLARLEKSPDDLELFNELVNQMKRAANAIMGAAKMVKLKPAITLGHNMEDCLEAVQQGEITLNQVCVRVLLESTSYLASMNKASDNELDEWENTHEDKINKISAAISSLYATSDSQDTTREINTEEPDKIQVINPDSTPDVTADSAPDITTAPKASIPEIKPTTSVDESMLELFRVEVETNVETLNSSLLDLENNPEDTEKLEALMRAAHSIKGAARMVGVNAAVAVAHIMEDGFTAAQDGKITLQPEHMDVLLDGVDMLNQISLLSAEEHLTWPSQHQAELEGLLVAIMQIVEGEAVTKQPKAPTTNTKTVDENNSASTNEVANEKARKSTRATTKAASPGSKNNPTDGVVRISTSRINRLIGLSGEFMMASGWISSHSNSLLSIKKKQAELITTIEKLRVILEENDSDEHSKSLVSDAQNMADNCKQSLTDRLSELEDFDRRTGILAGRLNHEVISSRMRPFKDGIQGFQRMVRDVARSLNKKINLKVSGENTQVDRDILQKIEAPLNHILRNAVDHGIESPEERIKNGKPETGTIHLEAIHNAGMLSIIVTDDGRGIDLENLRLKIVEKGMVNDKMARNLTESELLDFLFLPGFSTREEVTEISGRGVGLDVVHSTIQEIRGQIRSSTTPGNGLRIHLQLPLTLSMIRCLMVDIGGESYAFPLARIHNITKIHKSEIETLENLQYFTDQGNHIGLIDASQVFNKDPSHKNNEILEIIIIGDRNNRYGVVINGFLGEHSLAVHALDSRLGKIKDISAAAITDDGKPTLIIDVDDMLMSIEDLVSGKRLHKIKRAASNDTAVKRKCVLVVDDSLTVREVERKLLESRGYQVEIAVDGMDGWNTVRTGEYDLVISDIDMPRMNGIEFVSMIKQDPNLKSIPVMIVSYKDRQEDRELGLDAGADYYLAKGSFHDESLIDAVVDLIGEAV